MASTFIPSFSRRSLGALAALVSIFAPATPVAASQWDLPSPNIASVAATLGGESALARTWMAQGTVGQAAPVGAPATTLMATAAARIPQASVRSWSDRTSFGLPAAPRAESALRRSTNGGPDVFGSTAIRIGNTPYDAMWQRASAGPAPSLGGFDRSGNSEQLLRQVNAWVNRRITFAEDKVGNAPAEIWQSAAESIRRGRGDCEDYALAKLALLAANGFDRRDLFLVIARDLIARTNHAVLAVRTDRGFVILDNATDDLVEGDRVNDYRPIFSYSASGRWIHGFGGQAPALPPIQVASAATAIAAP